MEEKAGKEIAVITYSQGGRNAAGREGGREEMKEESQVRTGFLPGMIQVKISLHQQGCLIWSVCMCL